MLNTSSTRPSGSIPAESVVSFIRDLIGSYPNPEDPQPPGPWDPIIRAALERIIRFGPLPDPWLAMGPHPDPWRLAAGPVPDPWQAAFGPYPIPWHVAARPGPQPWWPALLTNIITHRHPELWDLFGGGPLTRAGLNPQPLPPRMVFAAALADELIGQATAAAQMAGWLSQEGAERGIIIVGGRVLHYVDELCGNDLRLKFPRPVPPPWWPEELRGTDLITMGLRFEVAAAAGDALAATLSQAGEKLVEAGMARVGQ